MKQSNIILLIVLLAISGCEQRTGTKLSDKDVIISKRLYSPDKKHVVFDYGYDNGAMGYSMGAFAIVKTADTNNVIDENIFHCIGNPTNVCYTLDKWLDNTTLQVEIDEGPFLRQGLPVDTSSFKVGEINVKVVISDRALNSLPIIEHYSVSPDEKKLLVAYLYPSGVSDLNISVINLTDTLPALGNIYTPLISGTYILFGKWTAANEIAIYVDDDSKEYGQSLLNKQHFCKVKIIPEKYVSRYSGIGGGWFNRELHPADFKFDKKLINNYGTINAVITDIYGWGDSYYTGLDNFFYEYKVNGRTYKSYFRANPEKCKLQKGNKIEIDYYKPQPIIHKAGKNYSR